MATFVELSGKYSFWYAVWAFIEYNTDGIIEDFAQRQMNSISLKKYNKSVFWKPVTHSTKE